MKHFLLVLFGRECLGSKCARSKNTSWQELCANNTGRCVYYRIVEKQAVGYLVRDYYMSGKIQSELRCRTVEAEILIKY